MKRLFVRILLLAGPFVTPVGSDTAARASNRHDMTAQGPSEGIARGELTVERLTKAADLEKKLSQSVQNLSTKLLDLAASLWRTLKERPEVTQAIARDPFTSEVKADAATAELLILLLHACDRVAAVTFVAALPTQAASGLRNSFMAGLVGSAVSTFVRTACPDEEAEEQEETQADLLHLYNTRALQYGFFPLGSTKTAENEALFKLAGIRLAEALECPDNAEVISRGVEIVMTSLVTLREQLLLPETFGQMIAAVQ